MRRFMRWPKLRQLALSLASAVVAALGLVLIYDAIIATFILGVVICHEFGHYFASHRHGAALPLFFGFGLFVVGVTAVRAGQDLPSYASGPIAGVAAALGGIAVGVVMGSAVLVEAALVLVLVELAGATIGSDGAKILKAIRKEQACSQLSA